MREQRRSAAAHCRSMARSRRRARSWWRTAGRSAATAPPARGKCREAAHARPAPARGILGTGNITLAAGATFKVDLGGIAAGVGGYDRLNVTGTVSLGGATLNASILGGFNPVTGTQFVIIANDGADTVTGTFAG